MDSVNESTGSEQEVFITRNNEKYGPYNLAEIENYITSGQILITDSAWIKGTEEWIPVSNISGINIPVKKVLPPPSHSLPSVNNQQQPVTQPEKDADTPWLAIILTILFVPIGIIFWIAYAASGHREKAKAVGWTVLVCVILGFILVLAAQS